MEAGGGAISELDLSMVGKLGWSIVCGHSEFVVCERSEFVVCERSESVVCERSESVVCERSESISVSGDGTALDICAELTISSSSCFTLATPL